MDREALLAMAPEEVGQAIGQVHALMAAAHATLLELVGVFDSREGWRADGCNAMTGWLEATLGITYRSATEWLRMAHALEQLPALAEAYRQGQLSTEKVAAASQIATPESDAALAEQAACQPVNWLLAAARRVRISHQSERLSQAQRSLQWWWEEEWLRLSAKLPAADGALVAKALERIAGGYGPDPESGLYDCAAARHADALVELAGTRLAADDDTERATVVVHVDASALAGGEGCAELEGGPAIGIQLARRLACDARLEVLSQGPHGAVGIGRARRQVPAWLLRQLRRRDGGCRFPGCDSQRHLQAHHIQHWAEGGATDADNLLLVCGRHHRLVHERGWSIAAGSEGDFSFVRPDGRAFLPGPPHIDHGLRQGMESWGLVTADTS